MRDSLKDRANDPASGGSRPFEPQLLETFLHCSPLVGIPRADSECSMACTDGRYGPQHLHSGGARCVSVTRLDAGFIHIINLSEPHSSMWFSLGVTALALIVVWRVRGSDALFRIGGDEFVLILGDAKASSALKVANDVRQLIREQAPQELPDFAISFGICCVDDSSSAMIGLSAPMRRCTRQKNWVATPRGWRPE